MTMLELNDPTLRHLYLELTRLDLLIHRRVAAMERAGRPLQGEELAARTLHMTADDVHRILQQPFGELTTAGGESVAEGLDEYYADAFSQIEEQIAAATEGGEESGSRLVRLAAACGLSRFDLDAFLVCLAPALDLRYERLYGYLNDDLTRRRPTVSMILDLLLTPGPQRLALLTRFGEDAPLLREHLIEPASEVGILQPVLLNQALLPDPSVVGWLLGDYKPGAALRPFVEFEPEPKPGLMLFTQEQSRYLEAGATELGMVALMGKDPAAQRSAMQQMAADEDLPLLYFDMAAAVQLGTAQPGLELHIALYVFLRDARLTGSLAAIAGWDRCLEDASPPVRLFTALCEHPGPLVIGSEVAWRPRGVERTRRLLWVDLPPPAYQQRRDFLAQLLAEIDPDDTLDVAGVAGRYVLTSGQLVDIVASAQDRAHRAARPLLNDDLFAAAREHSSPRLTTLARKLALRYTWDDLVLPEDGVTRLRELVQMVQGRALVLDEWGLGRKLAPSYGVSALFAGSPGTGKTMAAEVIARELGLDVYKIDLSGLVSKFIGETEKNLERVFSEAESSNAILFFDEADAVFGKRSEVKDAHDRYANIETSYLLQRMEAYDGVTILATNLRANLDEAFTRRLHAIIDFPFPDAAQRLRIWQALLPTTAPMGRDVDLDVLARRFKMAGGSIRNVWVAAAYLAAANGGVIGMSHLLHATRRELQKLGRLTDERDFAGLPQS